MHDANFRPKVLFVAPSFGASGGEVRALECIANWYINNSFEEIHVITTKRGATILKNRGLHNVKAYTLPIIKNEESFFRHLPFLASVIKTTLCTAIIFSMIKLKIKADLVIATSHFVHDLLPAVAYSRLTKAALFVWIHHLHPSLRIRTKYHPFVPSLLAWINDLLSMKLAKKSASMILTYPSIKNRVIDTGVPAHKIEAMQSGVNSKCITKIPPSNHTYDACFLGRIVPLKGIFDSVDIWKTVCSKITDAKLVLVGEGPLKYVKALKSKIENNNLSRNMILKGYLPERQKISSMKACKLFVATSHEEGFGITVIEAMACGLPVVGYDLPAYDIFKDAMIKVPDGDRETFANVVLNLLLDDKLRAKLSEKGKTIASQYSWDKIADNEFNILTQTLRTRQPTNSKNS